MTEAEGSFALKPFSITLLTLVVCGASAQPLTPEKAVQIAIENRSSVQAAKLKVDEAKKAAESRSAYPPLTLGFGYSSSDVGSTDEDLFLSQPLDLFGRVSAQRAVGQIMIAQAEADLRETKLEVQTEVLTRFFQAASAIRVSQVADQLVELSRSLEHAAARRFDEGRIPEIQVLRSSIEVEKAVQTANLHKNEARAAIHRLAASLGLPESPQDLQLDALLAPLPQPDFPSRPDLLRLQLKSNLAEAEALVARRSTHPEFAIIGARSPWRTAGTDYGARLQVTWSLLDHGRARRDAESHELAARAALAEYDDVLQSAQNEYAALSIDLEAAQSQLSSYQKLSEAARILAAKTQRGYDEGVGTHIDVLESTRVLREIEETIAKVGLTVHLVEIARYRAAGHLMETAR